MMRTVLQRTKSRVKFWLLANFLSPTFRAATARLAAALGCEIELVEYRGRRGSGRRPRSSG